LFTAGGLIPRGGGRILAFGRIRRSAGSRCRRAPFCFC